MPANRNALIRYKTIDNCLRNKYRQWTLDDLIEACSEALYDYEGIDKGVSKRTVQMDIQIMRSDKLGYHAPIVVTDKKYYSYSDPEYSITNIPLTNQDLNKLTEVVDILKQFKGFTHFQDLSGMVQKLENKIHVSRTNNRPIIDMEKNENLKGLEFIDPLFQAISKSVRIKITYQSFKARVASSFLFHPALLKEYRNRWFVLGKKKGSGNFMMLALDRVSTVEELTEPCVDYSSYDLVNHFRDIIGVTLNAGEAPQEIRLLIYGKHVPYVLTKPLHHSQKVVEKTHEGVIISIRVQHNFELEKEILSFGDNIKVLQPSRLRSKIRERLTHGLDLYHTELNESKVKHYKSRLDHKGTVVTNSVYSKKEVQKMGSLLHHYKVENHANDSFKDIYAIRRLLKEIPDLIPVVLNRNLKIILSYLGDNLILTKAIYFDKPAQSNWYVTWHQDQTINVVDKHEVKGYKGWTQKDDFFGVRPPEEILHQTVTVRIHLDDTDDQNGALQVIPGSHKKILSNDETQLIHGHTIPTSCHVRSGGIHLMKPLLLHASSKTKNMRNRRVLHLEFCSGQLADSLNWSEKLEFDY